MVCWHKLTSNKDLLLPVKSKIIKLCSHLFCAQHQRHERLGLSRLRRLVNKHVLEAQRRQPRVAGADAGGAHDVGGGEDLLLKSPVADCV